MKNPVKTVLLVVGILLLGYGVYTLIAPEASLDIGILEVETQDNTNAYTTIVLGLIALVLSYFVGKK